MNSTYKILSIDEITKNYDALIIDIWGVIYDGHAPYNKAINYLNNMIKEGKSIIFMSNTPRPGILSDKLFTGWGIDMNKASVYTSGDLLREQLTFWNDDVFKTLGRRFYHLGEDKNPDLLMNLEVDVVSNIKRAEFLLMSLYMDEGENLDHWDDLLQEAVDLNLPVVCANPDLVVNHGKKIRYCSGTFAEKFKKMGGKKVYYYGKPDSKIFNAVINKYKNRGIANKSRILMIGDTLETDIKGANEVGIDSAMVLTGNGDRIAHKIHTLEPDIFKNFQAKPTFITNGML